MGITILSWDTDGHFTTSYPQNMNLLETAGFCLFINDIGIYDYITIADK
jgi:hypothetical protein